MDPKANFLAVIDDLERCTGGWNSYDLLRIPGILRLLVADGLCLVDQVNREYRLKLRFVVGHVLRFGHLTEQERQETMLASVGDSLDPEYLQHYALSEPNTRTVTRDELLRLPVLAVEGSEVTVLQLIRHMAYVYGLTHSGEPSDPKDAALLEMRRRVELGQLTLGLREMRAIGRVVYRGLRPLREAVSKDEQPG